MQNVYFLKRRIIKSRFVMVSSFVLFFMSLNYSRSTMDVFAKDVKERLFMGAVICMMSFLLTQLNNKRKNDLIKFGECVWAKVDHTKTSTGLGSIYVYSSYTWKDSREYKLFMGAEAASTPEEYKASLEFINQIEYIPVFVNKINKDKYFSPVTGMVLNAPKEQEDIIRIEMDNFQLHNKVILSQQNRAFEKNGKFLSLYIFVTLGIVILRLIWFVLLHI